MEWFVSVANNNRHNQNKEKGLLFFTNNNKHQQIKEKGLFLVANNKKQN